MAIRNTYRINFKKEVGKEPVDIIATTYIPANGEMIHFRDGNNYVGTYPQDIIHYIENLGEYSLTTSIEPAPA